MLGIDPVGNCIIDLRIWYHGHKKRQTLDFQKDGGVHLVGVRPRYQKKFILLQAPGGKKRGALVDFQTVMLSDGFSVQFTFVIL